MAAAEDSPQAPIAAPHPMMLMNLLRAVYWYDEALQAALRRAGWPPVTRIQSMLFANLALGVRRPARLAHNLGITRQSMSQMLDELARRNIVRVSPDPSDGRASIVEFQPEGRALARAARATMYAIEHDLGQRLGADAMAALGALLARDWGDPPEVTTPTTYEPVEEKNP